MTYIWRVSALLVWKQTSILCFMPTGERQLHSESNITENELEHLATLFTTPSREVGWQWFGFQAAIVGQRIEVSHHPSFPRQTQGLRAFLSLLRLWFDFSLLKRPSQQTSLRFYLVISSLLLLLPSFLENKISFFHNQQRAQKSLIPLKQNRNKDTRAKEWGEFLSSDLKRKFALIFC